MRIDIVLCTTSYENDLALKMTFDPQPDLQKCTVTWRGLQLAETGQPAHFEVHLVDTTGDPSGHNCTTEHQVTAELRSNVDGSITPTSVAHKAPDTYEVSYKPNTRGQHVLTQVNQLTLKFTWLRQLGILAPQNRSLQS